ncbi:hypothetical protein F0P96_12710 [Hymenobacter busanensis]|uniref:Uncharacterized protein n=1 Tax=Hymenobacter busanensis TaxID=2607656 RepID=A0A7L5A0S7_9BACT|nr:hypothetical protein [Hymenobacter busanensis]KAA9332333.1 hypothetical protein F0P96_12710 [Hymenobacter busanensis]QHJ07330.1 hypothetical protein GUY19_08565 [Hymenobacter busanensis]
MPAYQSYFDHFFATLPISRVNFKALGTATLASLRQAQLGADFTAHETALQAALAGFDENLTDAGESTSGGTAAYRAARKQWLAFVDDTMKDHVTPKLRKLPVYADFKQYQKSKLAGLTQAELLLEAKKLLALYEQHAAALGHATLPAEAQAAYRQLAATTEARTTADAAIDQARVALSADWLALARALRRLKAQLELRFDDAEQVYRFFDFGKVQKGSSARRAAKQPSVAPGA